jgi:hypothetical protein
MTTDIYINAQELPGYRRSRIIAIPSPAEVHAALQRDAVARRILAEENELTDGMLVGSRLNLNVLKSTGVFVNTIHRATNKDGYRKNKGFFGGKVISYSPVVSLRDAYCSVQQAGRERIATGRASKFPMADVSGFLSLNEPDRFDGIELRFNPHREHLFCDESNRAVHYIEHATVFGHRVYARGIIGFYASQADAPKRAGDAPSAAVFIGGELAGRAVGGAA